MIYVSEIERTAPTIYKTVLQQKVYQALEYLQIPFERVDTDEAITMEDCVEINKKLKIDMVKTLFLCNRQQTEFYLFITRGNKPFHTKDFSHAMKISRVSFAPTEQIETMLGTKTGAVTIFSMLLETADNIKVIFDREVLNEEYYGCSDGTTTGYMKIETELITWKFLPYVRHKAYIIEV